MAPIVEAVLDLDCDLPAGFDLARFEEEGRNAFASHYPLVRRQAFVSHTLTASAGGQPPAHAVQQGLRALRFVSTDGLQLVQARSEGFSFNRLAPYTSLSEYLPEIERCWQIYAGLAAPLLVRRVRLRYINRIRLPRRETAGGVAGFFALGPSLPAGAGLVLSSFLSQQSAVDLETESEVRIILGAERPEGEFLPTILDIEVGRNEELEPKDWAGLSVRIEQLRALKNRVFQNTLTESCRQLLHL